MPSVHFLRQLAVTCVTLGALVGCAIKTPADPLSKTKAYKIRGRWYKPQKHYEYQAVGHASWYGPGFHGKKNACGYTFNENFICAAHRTLPLPSIVRVTNVKTGKSIKVLVVDRGPFIDTHKRIIDLSKGAAQKLGTHSDGLGHVFVTSLPKESAMFAQYIRRYQTNYKTRRLNWDKIYKRHFHH